MKKAESIVNRLSGDPSRIGYGYLAKAVEVVIERGQFPYRRVMNELYLEVAKAFDTDVTNVSRELARAVEDIWYCGNRKYLEKVAGHRVDDKPSPSQLIAQIVNYVMEDMATV